MNDKELRKLGRADLVEILCRQRELIDQLDEKNRQLQARAEKAEAALKECAASREEEQKRAGEDTALREDMRRLMEKVESMSHSMQRCTEATRALEAAREEADKLLAQAQAEADEKLAEAEQDIEQRRADFTRQCEEMVRGQEVLRRLMEAR